MHATVSIRGSEHIIQAGIAGGVAAKGTNPPNVAALARNRDGRGAKGSALKRIYIVIRGRNGVPPRKGASRLEIGSWYIIQNLFGGQAVDCNRRLPGIYWLRTGHHRQLNRQTVCRAVRIGDHKPVKSRLGSLKIE